MAPLAEACLGVPPPGVSAPVPPCWLGDLSIGCPHPCAGPGRLGPGAAGRSSEASPWLAGGDSPLVLSWCWASVSRSPVPPRTPQVPHGLCEGLSPGTPHSWAEGPGPLHEGHRGPGREQPGGRRGAAVSQRGSHALGVSWGRLAGPPGGAVPGRPESCPGGRVRLGNRRCRRQRQGFSLSLSLLAPSAEPGAPHPCAPPQPLLRPCLETGLAELPRASLPY